MMTHDEMIAVIQAHKEGKKIEVRTLAPPTGDWVPAIPEFNFSHCEYRVKPEEPPKPREFWLLRDKIYKWPDKLCDGPARFYDYSGNWNVGEKLIHVREVLPSEERA